MRRTQRSSSTSRRHSRDRGSALLISLIVVAGLSLLGLAFVGVAETESAISVNQRNGLQTQAIAEAGARAVVEWFQNPRWARDLAIMPANDPAPANMKRTRVVESYTGVYKPLTSQLLFDKPYRPAPQNRFFGDEETADITITDAIDATTLDNLNRFLFGANSLAQGRITEIRIYAPPIVGGNLVNGFWVRGERFGTATIRVTAEKWTRDDEPRRLLARRRVRIIVGEFPMPIPAGPIQTASNAAFGGNFRVHWGDEVALGNLNPALDTTRLPWLNPFERPPFERGYDAQVWPLTAGAPGNRNYIHELVDKEYEDPWAGSRARGANGHCDDGIACGTYAWNSVEGQPVHAGFQAQVNTQFPTSRAVTFPTIRYDTWKRIAEQGRGTKGIYYFQYASGENPPLFRRNGIGTARSIGDWVNTRPPGAGLGPGFYFFDTIGGVNPQNADGSTNNDVLTPNIDLNANDFDQDFLMSGFIYLNVKEYGTQGAGNAAPDRPYNMPGEPFRDVGHRFWAGGAWRQTIPPTPDLLGAGDGIFSWQEMNGNGKVDIVVYETDFNSTEGAASVPHEDKYLVKTWRDDGYDGVPCTVPPADTSTPAASACSEPHEPFLNIIYSDDRDDALTVGWEAHDTQSRMPRDLGADGITVPNCAAKPLECTSNGYDRNGALVEIPAIMNGVLYNEGAYRGTGQNHYFGAILVRGDIRGNGTADVWFDEKLIKDDWSPPGMPRVIVYSSMTDEQ